MKKKNLAQGERRWDAASLDELIDEFTVEAGGEDERILAFLHALEKHVALPCDGFVIGEPVSVVEFDYQGNQRRGLTAKCHRVDGREYEVAASEVALLPSTPGSHYLAAYRKWMGVVPYPPETRSGTSRESPAANLDLRGPVELVVLSVKQKAARCRLLGGDQSVTLRARRLWTVVPGEIAVVRPGKQWNYARNPYLSGVIESTRLDVAALGLVPLRLEERGIWDPSAHYWGEEDEPIEEWAKPMIARGPRIGELSLSEGFAGLLPWGWIDNRPFLRCMQGFGLCLWRLGRFREADRIFDRMLWLNPSDNQGVRFLIGDVRAQVAWEKRGDR